MNYECTEERFLKDVAKHEMTVIRDDGINRHLRFKNPNDSSYWFDLITWPGTLCIDGDCGTYVFKRTPDMFQFFRTDSTSLPNGKTDSVKLQSIPLPSKCVSKAFH